MSGYLKKLILLGGTIALALIVLPQELAFADSTALLYPIDNGSNNSWDTSTSATNFKNVNEKTCNGTTNYVYTTTTGKRDLYKINLSSIPNDSTITKIEIFPCASKDSAMALGSSTMNLFWKYNNTYSTDSGNYNLSGITPASLSPTSWNDLTFVKTSNSNLEVGTVYSSGTRGARLSQIAAKITYIKPIQIDGDMSYQPTPHTTIAWEIPSISDIDGFSIQGSTNNIIFTEINRTAVSSYTNCATGLHCYQIDPGAIPALPAGSTFYYRLRWYSGSYYSPYSNTIRLVGLNNPTNLNGAQTGSSVQLNWATPATNTNLNNNEIVSLEIERSEDGGLTFNPIASFSPNTSSFTDQSIPFHSPGFSTQFKYRIYAKANNNERYSIVLSDIFGLSGYSDTATVDFSY